MSRRHTARTVDVLNDLDHQAWEEQWSDTLPVHEPIEDWQTAWAGTTLDVCAKIWSKQGARLYFAPSMRYLRDDLKDWLYVQAQELANKYQPHWGALDPERMWGAYLWKNLLEIARWHFRETVGDDRHPSGAAAVAAHNRPGGIGSVEAFTEAAGDAWVPRLALHGDPLNVDPLAIILRAETFAHDLAEAERYVRDQRAAGVYTTRSDTCMILGCDHAARSRGLCATHLEQDQQLWTEKTCNVPDCGAPHKAKGLCKKHYVRHGRGALPEDLLQYVETTPRPRGITPNEAPCQVDGCDRRGAKRGMCDTHYRQWWHKQRRAAP